MNSIYEFILKLNKWLTPMKVVFILFVLGQVVYINSWGNSFIFDDITQIVLNPTLHSTSLIPSIFFNSSKILMINGYYRPLPDSIYSIIYSLFQANTFYFHYVQTLFHIANAILIYLIFRKFIKPGIAFFLSSIFLVHPITEETVVYISNLQDVLFVFLGLLAFYLLLKNTKKLTNIIFINFLLFLSLLSKETGILFLILSLIYAWLFNKSKRFIYTFFSVATVVVCLFMRFLNKTPVREPTTPIMTLSFLERIINIPAIIFYYIKILIFPKILIAFNSWVIHDIRFDTFYLPLLFDCIFFAVIFAMAIFLYKKANEKKIVLFFLLWFLAGIFVHLQLVALDFTVADRFFYFPFIGFLALVGLFIQSSKLSKSVSVVFIILGIFLIVSFSLRTVARNADWKNELTLFSHDEPLSKNDFTQEFNYGNALIEEGKQNEALTHLQYAISIFPQSYRAWNNIGLIYYQNGNIMNAKKAWDKAIVLGKQYGEFYGTYENMSLLLLKYDDVSRAKTFIRKATILYPGDSKLWYYDVIAEYKTKEYDKALVASIQYFNLKRDQQSYDIYQKLLRRQPIDIRL